MKKIAILIMNMMLVSLFLLGCGMLKNDKDEIKEKVKNMSQKDANEYIVNSVLNKMTIEEKVGQLMMVGISGTTLDDNDIFLLKKAHVGGVILFDRNMKNKEQVKELITSIQQQSSSPLPLFVAIDEEGGLVARMRNELEVPPAAADIGSTGDVNVANDWAVKTSKNIKALGFNVNFAPVADIDSDNKRSYSKNTETVTNFVQAAVNGYKQENIICALKHFPGIGKSKVDSHIDGSIIDASVDTLEKEDILPFSKIISSNDNNDFMVMVSHLSYPALDKEAPASISKNIITNILRRKLGFNGIIITDDLEMGAISKHYNFVDMGIRTIKAGSDIALVCHEPEHIKMVYDGLLNAVRNGEISKERLDESCYRILMVKVNQNKKIFL